MEVSCKKNISITTKSLTTTTQVKVTSTRVTKAQVKVTKAQVKVTTKEAKVKITARQIKVKVTTSSITDQITDGRQKWKTDSFKIKGSISRLGHLVLEKSRAWNMARWIVPILFMERSREEFLKLWQTDKNVSGNVLEVVPPQIKFLQLGHEAKDSKS
nr:hypothetical protein BaRGS_032568 [Batillaria attramentaria]